MRRHNPGTGTAAATTSTAAAATAATDRDATVTAKAEARKAERLAAKRSDFKAAVPAAKARLEAVEEKWQRRDVKTNARLRELGCLAPAAA